MRAWGIGLLLAAGLLLAVVWWGAAPVDGDRPLAGFETIQARPLATHAALAPVPAAIAPASTMQGMPPPGGAAPPPGMNAAQWASLSAEILARPGGAAELQRLANYLEWADTLQRFRAARGAGSASTDLARKLESGLGERLRQREVSAAEAQRIKSAVLDITDPDAASRERQLRAWAAATLPQPAVESRQIPFEHRQAESVAAWSARPPAARDPAALTRELDALRQQVFSPPAPSAVAQQEYPK